MRTIAGGALERKIFQPYPFYPDLLVIFICRLSKKLFEL
jgi:hypothetical protein